MMKVLYMMEKSEGSRLTEQKEARNFREVQEMYAQFLLLYVCVRVKFVKKNDEFEF